MRISYAITVHNEIDEIKQLIPYLLKRIKNSDEIVVLMDNKGPDELWEYLISMEFQLGTLNTLKFNDDFSEWKNKLNSMCSGDYIFQIDADELPSEFLLTHIHDVLKLNTDIDLILVPRINIVNGITQEHINKWGWRVDENNYINFPDYQWRLHRNSPEIKWVGKVHEKIDGFKTSSALPANPDWALMHIKTIDKQVKQNSYYNGILESIR